MRNGSTNIIRLSEEIPAMDFELLLTGSRGMSYYLTPELRSRSLTVGLSAGRQRAMTIPVTLPQNIEPGAYQLMAARVFRCGAGEFRLVSNALKIQVKP